jgi:hypothetical protein
MPDVIEVVSLSDTQVEILEESGSNVEVLAAEERIIEIVVPGPQGPEPTVAASINYVFDGGGVQLTTGLKGSIIVPFACTINSWSLVAEPSGSIEVDIWRTSLADYPPELADSITGSAKPLISGGQTATSSSLGTWDTEIAEGDVLSFMVDAVNSVILASISLKVTRL